MKYTTVLSIAGSDCSGRSRYSGRHQDDFRFGMLCRQHRHGRYRTKHMRSENIYPIPAQIVKEQIQAVTEDMQIDALKIGMVTDEGIIAVIADFLSSNRLPAVFDPVLVSSSGYSLVKPKHCMSCATA